MMVDDILKKLQPEVFKVKVASIQEVNNSYTGRMYIYKWPYTTSAEKELTVPINTSKTKENVNGKENERIDTEIIGEQIVCVENTKYLEWKIEESNSEPADQ